jgi:hypothetical protein
VDLLEFGYFCPAANDEGCALVNRFRLDIHDPGLPGNSLATGLFGNEGKRIGFVEKAQFAIGILLRWRIEEYTALEERAVEVRHQRADVARSVSARTQAAQVGSVGFWKAIGIGFVDRVCIALDWHFHIGEGEYEGADFGLQREAVDTLSGCVNKDSGGSVNDVACGYLFPACLKNGGVPVRPLGTAQDGEDRTNADVYVDVGRAVERIEDNDVLPALGAVDGDRLFVFFRDQEGDAFTRAQTMQDGLVGVDIKFLLSFALHIGGASGAENVHQSSSADLGLDHFSGQRHAGEQRGKVAASSRELIFLLLQNMLLNSHKHALERIARPEAFPDGLGPFL